LLQTYQIRITGLVQGVGFRPFVYRLAREFQLQGTVENRNDGVRIRLNATGEVIRGFVETIKLQAPQASEIRDIRVKVVKWHEFNNFRIIKSRNVSDQITLVSPDIAVCDDCLHDMKIQPNRIDYPFTNCTNCGPRFTIIRDLPYDRSMTTMDVFKMCKSCKTEYHDVPDRRFHAQPVACKNCGPHYTLHLKNRKIEDQEENLIKTRKMLHSGKIMAIKGLGGYFLACDAQNEKAVARLRGLKIRERKPFAVMFRDFETLKKTAEVSAEEEKAITSWRRPIVLLRTKRELATSVSMGFPTVGAMLPYMPFHYLLFRDSRLEVLVLTSGNFSDEPILISNHVALETFLPSCDGVLSYNRDIYNRVDDSVSMVVCKEERLIRRSRGYVPAPVVLDFEVDGIVAVGAELVNCFALGKGNQAFLSQHIGDLKNLETFEFYTESLERFKKIFRITSRMMVSDLHPEYLSTKFAMDSGLPLIRVQHHHAHIASCMAENGLNEPVMGVAFDGIGLGDDGNIWGGEFLICDLKEYKRFTHFEYTPMPGGDQATLNPWRMAVSYLYQVFGETFYSLDMPFLKDIDPLQIKMVVQMIEKKLNTPLTSSVGRLFDAIAALTGLCTRSTFHAEAPMRLEAAIREQSGRSYDFDFGNEIVVKPMIRQIATDILAGEKLSGISLKFHNTIVNIILEVALHVRETNGIKKIVLSGGTFQNRYLLEQIEPALLQAGFQLYLQKKVPCNDGGIALGQLAIAAQKI